MNKLKTLPKKGQSVIADYVINGKVKKAMNLGVVTKASKKSFFCKDEDGNVTERFYTFGASNGVRLRGFQDAPKEEAEEVESIEKED